MNRCARPSRVHAADYQIDVIGDPVTFGNVLGYGFPLQPPEQIESVDQRHGFEQPDFTFRKRLTNTVGRRDSIPVNRRDRESRWVARRKQGMMEMRKPGENRTPSSTASYHGNSHRSTKQKRSDDMHSSLPSLNEGLQRLSAVN
jgi:hypothetical protein